jgi:hypothetical protein
MHRTLMAAALAAFVFSCASTNPAGRQLCLQDNQRRTRSGQVIAEREDGARLFRFDDPAEGDHGFMWVSEGDASRIGPCRQVTPGSAESSGTDAPWPVRPLR